MNQDEKTKQPQQAQPQQQLQILLKETLKENKTLQNKHSKLEAKYVEVFKELKLVKKDHSLFIAFLTKYFNVDPNLEPANQPFQEQPIGQYEMSYLQKLAQQKEAPYRLQIEELEKALQTIKKDSSTETEKTISQKRQELTEQFQKRIKNLNEEHNKEVNCFVKELDQYKRANKTLTEELAGLKKQLQTKSNDLSKTIKEKLKLQHHLNNIRKMEIAEELSPQKEKEQEKLMTERNQFLSLRQQVESLMAKRDELKRELKEKQQQIAAERKKNELLEDQISQLKTSRQQMDEKYELIRQCSLQQLENLILSHHFDATSQENAGSPPPVEKLKSVEEGEQSEQIQKQYLKNVLSRYIKAEISGAIDQSLMLLEVIGNILKLDAESSVALENYKAKRKQWWYIKY